MEHPGTDRGRAAPFYVGPWLVQPALNSLTYQKTVRLTPKVMHVLSLLAHHPGAVVTREAFMDEVWRDEVVGEEAVTHAISALRKAFGDAARDPQYIQTIPKTGYRLIAPVTLASEAEQAAPQATPLPQASPAPASSWRWLTRTSAAALLLVLLLWGGNSVWPLLGPSPSPTSHVPLQAVPFTSSPGLELAPAFSPDGTTLAFTRKSNIYIKQVGAETALQLTDTPAHDTNPIWSPDGQQIAFVRSSPQHCAIVIIPALGGPARKMASCQPNYTPTLSWHPEGEWLAFSDTDVLLGQETIRLLSIATRQRVDLTALPRDGHYPGDIFPAFSPDGKHLAFVRKHMASNTIYVQPVALPATPSTEQAQQVKVHLTTLSPSMLGEPSPVAAPQQAITGLTWTPDGEHLVFSSFQFARASLWQVPATGGDPEWLGVESTRALQPTLSLQKNRLAFVEGHWTQNIWQHTITRNTIPQDTVPSVLIASTQIDLNPQFSPDGEHIVFGSSRSGHAELWLSDSQGDNLVQLTNLKHFTPPLPSWSPEGQRIAFTSASEGHLDLYVIDLEDGLPRRLTDDPSNDGRPSWSADGQWIYFSSDREGYFQTWRIPASGGTAELVLADESVSPMVSPDGQFIYVNKIDTPGLWRYPHDGGPATRLVEDLHPDDWNNWMLRDEGLYYIARTSTATPLLRFFSFATNQSTTLFMPPHPVNEVAGIAVTVDEEGTRILVTQTDAREGDIMLVEGIGRGE